MRNPLNSVVSQNIVNDAMLKELLLEVQKLNIGEQDNLKNSIMKKVKQL